MGKSDYFFYPVKNNEGVIINSDNDFELALASKKKRENRALVLKMIDRVIEEKEKIFSVSTGKKSICFVGHSQLDQWKIEELAGYKVRNCAVSGISSFEYYEKILQRNLLNCEADCFLMMHGTNDIVWDYAIDEIVESIQKNVDYIKRRTTAPIIFISCIHVNGRLDRSNDRIDELNVKLNKKLNHKVKWIDTGFMDDLYGTLSSSYTKDGLHFSDEGYDVLKKHIEANIKELGL